MSMSQPGPDVQLAPAADVARVLVAHYEQCFREHGDTHRGVDWPTPEGAALRYDVMLDMLRPHPGQVMQLLDFGCGAGHLIHRVQSRFGGAVSYLGADGSSLFVSHCRATFPGHSFHLVDLDEPARGLPEVDYIVLNGVFTERLGRSYAAMFAMTTQVLGALWPLTRRGMAFNFMSKHVDWERDDLFHVPFDEIYAWLKKNLSRHVVIRADYGLYEYTLYVFRDSNG